MSQENPVDGFGNPLIEDIFQRTPPQQIPVQTPVKIRRRGG